ncbi:hypothetical protein Kpho02_40300 [Kitasatospora phosalacinea]|uniref:Lipoprotein n=1 Tax=Kitasatospora phosalacinea TaxID=2065 RepID=A0A9W6V1J1_9ACTN|nr:hypothetical protein [Kitasatospora phosalacinea]GLW71731.1 hypothetical protein Kpho02_40300 [Kitasatospora phosalacinea]
MTVRTRKLGLRVAALAATALVLTACNDDGSSDQAAAGASSPAAAAPSASATGKAKARPTGSGKPSSAPAAGDKAAQARLGKIVLNAQDVGEGFVGNGDDDTSTDSYTMDASCVSKADGSAIAGLTATVTRYLREDHESNSTFLSTGADQFTGPDAAHRDIQDAKDEDRRCPANTNDAGDKFTGTRTVQAPAVTGADEVYAVEGTVTFAPGDNGPNKPAPFTYYMARKGSVVVRVFVAGDPGWNPQMAKDDARRALAKLATRW